MVSRLLGLPGRYARWLMEGRPETPLHQIQFMVACCLVASIVAIGSLPFAATPVEAGAMLGFLAGVILSPLTLRMGLSPSLAKALAMGVALVFFVVIATQPDALDEEDLFWFATLPLTGGLLFGRGGVVAGGALAIASCLGIVAWYRGPGSLGQVETLAYVVDLVFFLLATMVLTAIYDALHSRAVVRLERAVAARTTLLARMSHELRTPMNGVLGMVDVLQDGVEGDTAEGLAIIGRNGQAMVELIDQLLDHARLEAGALHLEHRPFSPAAVARDVAELHRGRAGSRGLELSLEIAEQVPALVMGDPLRLRQVLQNLVQNALKFTEQGGVHVDLRWSDGMLTGAVSDTGIGMDEAQVERIFLPFAQAQADTAARFGGSGLGLAISRELCRGMGGDLEVSSTAGVGSTFRFVLAAPEAAADPAPSAPAVAPDAASLQGVVLIVDDNEVNRLVARRLCERLGLEVREVSDGAAAVAAVSGGDPPDVVLMDCWMPGVDGFEATRRIRALDEPLRGLPVIALTASVMAEDLERCREVGMDDVLAKPIDKVRLAEVLGRALQAV